MPTLAVDFALMALGLAGLWVGSLFTIDGAVRLSERYDLSHGFVGLVVLAIGTDLPELVVAIGGGVQQLQGVDTSGVVVGSAFGSAITQGTLVLGLAGLFGYLPVETGMVRRDGFVLLLAIALAAAFSMGGGVGRLAGSAMLCAYVVYLLWLLHGESGRTPDEHEASPGRFSAGASIAGGLGTIAVSAHVVVSEGVAIASELGVSQTLLGVILIGAGTSLPELVLSVRAAAQRHAGLVVGNVIGSNVFDLLVPVGVAAAIHPLSVEDRTLRTEFPTLAVATLLLLVFLRRRRGLQRHEALVLVGVYAVYAGARVYLG